MVYLMLMVNLLYAQDSEFCVYNPETQTFICETKQIIVIDDDETTILYEEEL